MKFKKGDKVRYNSLESGFPNKLLSGKTGTVLNTESMLTDCIEVEFNEGIWTIPETVLTLDKNQLILKRLGDV